MALQGSSEWVNKITVLCAKAFGNHSQHKQNANDCYSNNQYPIEVSGETDGQVESRLRENESKHEIEELWLSGCEDSLHLKHDARVLDTPAANELNRQATARPSRTTWQGLNPRKQSNYVPLQKYATGDPSEAFQAKHPQESNNE